MSILCFIFNFKGNLSHFTIFEWGISFRELVHSVLRVVLTLKISRVNQISIFISGWVVGITPYAQFCPIPSPLLLIFLKNGFEVKLTIENWQKDPNLLMWKKCKYGGTELDKTECRGWFLQPILMWKSISDSP